MRMRRKPWARPELDACSFYIKNPEEKKEIWTKAFKNRQPIYLELGCGKGMFIAKLASQNPQINYIAIDIKSEVLALAKRNIESEYLKNNMDTDNILLTAYEILLIQNIIGKEDVVDRIYINFCNPWPKPRHNKRRLTYTTQLEKYKEFLKDDGEIYFKTDDDDLFLATKKYLNEAGFKIQKETNDLQGEKCAENITTEHEEMFMKKGIKIKALIAKKHKL